MQMFAQMVRVKYEGGVLVFSGDDGEARVGNEVSVVGFGSGSYYVSNDLLGEVEKFLRARLKRLKLLKFEACNNYTLVGDGVRVMRFKNILTIDFGKVVFSYWVDSWLMVIFEGELLFKRRYKYKVDEVEGRLLGGAVYRRCSFEYDGSVFRLSADGKDLALVHWDRVRFGDFVIVCGELVSINRFDEFLKDLFRRYSFEHIILDDVVVLYSDRCRIALFWDRKNSRLYFNRFIYEVGEFIINFSQVGFSVLYDDGKMVINCSTADVALLGDMVVNIAISQSKILKGLIL